MYFGVVGIMQTVTCWTS